MRHAHAIQVRPAEDSDEDAIAAVRASAIQTLRRVYRPSDAAVARREQTAAHRQVVVALFEGDVCGVVEYRLEEDRLHLMGLGVSAAHRGHGIARRLVEHLAALAAGAGKRSLSLYTVRQTGNVAIFEHLGFGAVSEEPADGLVSVTAAALTEVYMVRSLRGGQHDIG